MSTIQLRRFHTPGSEMLDHEKIVAVLSQHPFEDFAYPTQEVASGFVVYGDLLNTEFFYDDVILDGRFARFGIRIDQKKVDAKALAKRLRELIDKDKAEFNRAVQTQLDTHPKVEPQKYRLSKDRKKELKARAKEELVKKSVPSPEMADVIWDLEKEMLYLLSTKSAFKKILPLRLGLFTDQHAQEMHPIGCLWVRGLQDENSPIGIDFLTWLWDRIENRKDEYMTLAGEQVEPQFCDSITVEEPKEGANSMAFSGNLDKIKELRIALDAGRKISSATIKFKQELGQSWKVSLKSVDFATTIKCPKVGKEEKPTGDPVQDRLLKLGQFFDSVALMTKPLSYLDQLFDEFCREQEYRKQEHSIMPLLDAARGPVKALTDGMAEGDTITFQPGTDQAVTLEKKDGRLVAAGE